MYYGFEYFTGANVVVEVGGIPMLEAAGLSMQIVESRRPIYGYSSRHFDAVSRGQVLVQGELLINMVHRDYLLETMLMSRTGVMSPRRESIEDIDAAFTGARLPVPVGSTPGSTLNDLAALMGEEADPAVLQAYSDTLREEFWPPGSVAPNGRRSLRRINPHDADGEFDIIVTFGDRDKTPGRRGATSYRIEAAHFLGRSQQISLDDIVVEMHSFIARDLLELPLDR